MSFLRCDGRVRLRPLVRSTRLSRRPHPTSVPPDAKNPSTAKKLKPKPVTSRVASTASSTCPFNPNAGSAAPPWPFFFLLLFLALFLAFLALAFLALAVAFSATSIAASFRTVATTSSASPSAARTAAAASSGVMPRRCILSSASAVACFAAAATLNACRPVFLTPLPTEKLLGGFVACILFTAAAAASLSFSGCAFSSVALAPAPSPPTPFRAASS
mmetsp:Transcript_27593/g.55540  ORF Transcript_27593/g.55540 Transcript_27593/m.55540 type:complete len:217 (-) Transcript_27593:1180-1830(-)